MRPASFWWTFVAKEKPAIGGFENSNGGGVCESNTPKTLFTPRNGFEGRGPHQGTIRLHRMISISHKIGNCNKKS